jgi:shikimate dehydrogenase
MPHKSAVLDGLDELSPDAEDLGAVNCVVRRGAILRGENTDGAGLLDALRLDEGVTVDGRACVVVGAGGAGRAVARALGRAGADAVVVVNRDQERARRAAALAGPIGRVGTADDLAAADLVVNATPLGMGVLVTTHREAETLPLDVARLRDDAVLVDLIYHPAVTPLLAAGRARGLRTVNGLGMLIHQAAHAFRHWTSEAPPLAAMSAAAVAGLGHHHDA